MRMRWELRASTLYSAHRSLIVTSPILVVIVWLTDAPRATRVFVSATILTHLAVAWVAERRARRDPSFPYAPIAVTGAIVAGFALSFLGPQARFFSLGVYALNVVWLAGTTSMSVAVTAGVVSGMFLAAAEARVPAADRLSPLVIAWFGACLVTIALFVNSMQRVNRRSSDALAQMHAALQAASAETTYDATLEALVRVATDATGALRVGVLLMHGDHLVLAAPTPESVGRTQREIAALSRDELTGGAPTPIGAACAESRTVVVSDLAHERRFSAWVEDFRSHATEPRAASLACVPLRSDGVVIGVVVAIFDSTITLHSRRVTMLTVYAERAALLIVRARAAEEHRHAALRSAESDRMKSEFLALVSHELRTPLTAAKGYVDTVLLQWEHLSEERRRALLERASDNSDGLARLIDQLLEYSRLEVDEAPVTTAPTRLSDVVQATVAAVAPMLERHVVEADVDGAVTVDTDATLLGRVLGNLLSNATKYSPAGSRISIAAARDDGEVLLSVADGGPGIPLAEQSLVFERFYRRAADRSGGRPGTGLGLAIARRYVEALGGRLWVESEPGAGATFVCALPTAPSGAAPTGLRFDPRATRGNT